QGFSLAQYLQEQKTIVETALDQSLVITEPVTIYEAMRYSLLAGGKRLRPILCLAACEMLGGTAAMAMNTACALEMIHTMSLIHDDLPAMDNDDLRRGKPTNHKVYGEDIAILAGDALLSYAFEYVARTPDVPAERLLQVIVRLGQAVGAEGLVGGQVVDLESETDVAVETLNFIHTHKTGALLEVCVTAGAILAGAKPEEVQLLSRYAQNIGLAFQIVDDILSLEKSQAEAQKLVAEAIASLEPYGEKANPLKALAEYI
uniref:Geranylgeranyl pyrophosphate synthase n=1 Tax=Picosynechococcus sp. (strain ATCC 27264 / PCC 7002 / PR-6) TaxID=32049 RepID=UPI0015882A17|nr:Chain B, Geranylgeranyl pyrophosphate synthase [Picosynechococcus sp. PCC 7002]